MLPGFGSIRHEDRVVEAIQANVAAAFSRLVGLNGNPVLDYSRVTGIALGAGSNVIKHKLNRTPVGWFVTDMTGAAVTLFRTAKSATTITLTSSGTATADFYFF